MTFQPRIHENGNVCCSAPTALCEKCEQHFRDLGLADDVAALAADLTDSYHRVASSRPAGNSAAPPDPYAAGLAKLRALLPDDGWPTPPTIASAPSGCYVAPDPYAADIAKLKENRR